MFARTLAFLVIFAVASTSSAEEKSILPIVGVGTVKATPDIATVTIGVVTYNTEAMLALEGNSDSVAKILLDLKSADVNEKDIKTSNFSIQPEFEYNQATNTQVFKSYVVVNQVIVCVRDLNKLGFVLTAVVKSGANNVNGLTYSCSKSKEYLDEARKLAVADAKAKANLYAKEFDMTLGRLISASESEISPRITYARLSASPAPGASGNVPTSSGELEFTISLSAQYELR